MVQHGADLVRLVCSETNVSLAGRCASSHLQSQNAGDCVHSVASDASERPVDGLRRVVLECERHADLRHLQEPYVDDPSLDVHVLDSVLLRGGHRLGSSVAGSGRRGGSLLSAAWENLAYCRVLCHHCGHSKVGMSDPKDKLYIPALVESGSFIKAAASKRNARARNANINISCGFCTRSFRSNLMKDDSEREKLCEVMIIDDILMKIEHIGLG